MIDAFRRQEYSMNMHRPLLLLTLLCLPTLLFAQRELTTERSALFSGAGNCVLCHGPSTNANVTRSGVDVSPPNLWRSTMMANAARDPFWQAVVASESANLPHLADIIEDKCINCHAPMAHEQARQDGLPTLRLTDAEKDPLAMDGVSCTLCHQVVEDNFGTIESFSGGYEIARTRVTYGPYENPLIQPMLNVSGYEPVYSRHIERAELCATCHTLFTPFVDDAGEIAGEFPEQTPFIEWSHSVYPSRGMTCQTCHMPAIDEAIRLSNLPPHSPERTPYFLHHFVGGNTVMQSILKANAEELGVTALDEHLDSTSARTLAQLRGSTIHLDGGALLLNDTLRVVCEIENRTGHKFPSGFPSRRAWLHVTVRNNNGDIVFESGALNRSAEISGIDSPYEQHHTIITREDQVQIYEAILGDVNGNATVDLLRAARYLKDNRIPPLGFMTSSMDNDTIAVIGAARDDADFCRSDTEDGLGRDVTEYHIAIDPTGAPFTVDVAVMYQSIKPEYIRNLEKHKLDKTERMVQYWNTAPVRWTNMAQSRWISQLVHVTPAPVPSLLSLEAPWPMPARKGIGSAITLPITLSRTAQVQATLVDILGREQLNIPLGPLPSGRTLREIDISSLPAGMYMLSVVVDKSRHSQPVMIAR
jgi:hypothetical protein